MRSPEGFTRVEIYDQPYHIKGSIESEYIREVAAYVDKKMREISATSKTADSVKVAVLAALNIADELFQAKAESRKFDSIIFDKSLECSRLLDQVLKR